MIKWLPCSSKEFIKRLKKLGFTGEFHGTKCDYMFYRHRRLAIPNNDEYSVNELRMMIKEVDILIGHKISADKWNNL
jgi:predicted RNA binding protein YcfA (HicA-like mRNA interferase family)